MLPLFVLALTLVPPQGSARAIFEAPRGLSEINGICREKGPFLSCDGLTLYFHSDRSSCGDPTVADVWVARRSDGSSQFGTPEPVMQNGGDPATSCDELSLYFIRAGAGGDLDIFVATRSNRSEPFSNPEPLTEIDSPYGEYAPRLSHDALDLYFVSRRPGGLGALDIWVSHRSSLDAPFGEPVDVSILNSEANDTNAAIAHDGLSIVFGSTRPSGHGQADLYRSTRASLTEPWGSPENLAVLNSPRIDKAPALSGDGRTLIFRSTRPGGEGRSDLYVARDARGGTVEARAERWEDVLFVNGSAGDATRRVFVAPGTSLTVTLAGSAGGPASPRYAIFGSLGSGPSQAVLLPRGIGALALPLSIGSGTREGAALLYVNTFPGTAAARLGDALFPAAPAPGEILRLESLPRLGATLTLQGVIQDFGSAATVPLSTTNAVAILLHIQ